MELNDFPLRIERNKRIRRVRMRITREGELLLYLPRRVSDKEGLAFVEKNKDWVQKNQAKVARANEQILAEIAQAGCPDLDTYIERLRQAAREELPLRLHTLSSRYGFAVNSLRIKHNKSNWGSCSARKNINLNLNLMRVEPHLRDYVILHELAHLSHFNHSDKFHIYLEQLCVDLCRRDYPSFLLKYEAAIAAGILHKCWEKELKTKKLF